MIERIKTSWRRAMCRLLDHRWVRELPPSTSDFQATHWQRCARCKHVDLRRLS